MATSSPRAGRGGERRSLCEAASTTLVAGRWWPGGSPVAGQALGGFGGRFLRWAGDYAPGMRFQVLGPLEVEADDGPVVLGGPKERLLLAQLLTRPNQVVPVETLVRGLWGEQPPNTAAKTLQSHVKRLRRALERGRSRGASGEWR